MPKYEALCRIEEGPEIAEYHIRTVDAERHWPPQADDPTERIKKRSRKKYGTPIEEVEKMLAARLAVGAPARELDEIPAVERVGDDGE